jgi:hypothetical protein
MLFNSNTIRSFIGTSILGGGIAGCSNAAQGIAAPRVHQVDLSHPQRLPHFDHVLLLETSETSANVSIGDLNNDGNRDIVLAKGRHWPLVSRVLLNDGHGRFPIVHNLGDVPLRSYSAQLVDVNGDGYLDVVVGNDAPDPKLVYLNDGKGNFHRGSTYGRPEWPTRNVAVADLNGDGLPDIVVANRTENGPGANYVCLNRGNGKFDADCIAFSHESGRLLRDHAVCCIDHVSCAGATGLRAALRPNRASLGARAGNSSLILAPKLC